MFFNSKYSLFYLKFYNSEMVQVFDDKNHLKKICKLRFYGDNRKEQLEKYYKNTNISNNFYYLSFI